MKYLKLILILIFVGLFIYLFVLDFVPGKNLVTSYDFCHHNPMMTELSPGDRLWPIDKSGTECSQRVAKSPVYFDIRVPQVFKNAKVEIIYQNPAQEKFQFGPQTVKNEWQWLLQDVKEKSKNGDWQTAEMNFDLTNIYQRSPVMRWLISAPTIEQDKQVITIKEIRITLEKDALNASNFWEQVKGWGRKIVRR